MQHDGIAEALLQAHSLTVEVTGDHVWLLLPEPEALPDPQPGIQSTSPPG
jgi:hypothetical protein